jgi:hypothetical protein
MSEVGGVDASIDSSTGGHDRECNDGDNKDNSNHGHGPVDLAPPPSILISNLIDGTDARIKGSFHICETTSCFFATHWFRRKRKEGGDEPRWCN